MKPIFSKRRNFLLILIVLIGCFIVTPMYAQTVTFKGTVTGDLKGYNKIYLYNNVTDQSDSTTIKDGKFTIKIPFSVPTRYMFYLGYALNVKGGFVPFGILVDESTTVHMKVNIKKGLSKAKVTGSVTQKLYEHFLKQLRRGQKKVQEKLKNKYGKKFVIDPDKSSSKYKSYLEDKKRLSKRFIRSAFVNLVEQHPDSYASVFVLNRYGKTLDVAVLENLFNKVNSHLKQLHEGKELANLIQGMKAAQLGQTVANFAIPNSKGERVSIRQFRGKYVLLDFWASWCEPCIASFPHLRKVYNTYKNENFALISISIDKNKEAWLQALKKYSNPWLQLYDNKEIASSNFAVTTIPATFLISPEGKIMAKGLRGKELTRKLKEIFN